MMSIPRSHPQNPTVTVSDLLDLYERKGLSSKAKNTQAHYKWIFPLFRDLLGHLPLTEVTPAHLRIVCQRLLDRYPPGTVRVYLYILRGAFTTAVREYELLE